MIIDSVHFRNFKALRNAVLPLGRFTLIVGPNGSGKSTALQALQAAALRLGLDVTRFASIGSQSSKLEVLLRWVTSSDDLAAVKSAIVTTRTTWTSEQFAQTYESPNRTQLKESDPIVQAVKLKLRGIRLYSFDATALASPTQLRPGIELSSNGANLAGALDQLRDRAPERFEELNGELRRWLPEFDRVLFDTPDTGTRLLQLRTRHGGHVINSDQLSQGTLLAVAMLTLAYQPTPPSVVCLEEPDRGIHPRILRRVRDALYRLSYPDNFADGREPVQVIATTHSPYFLDLYREHPEEVVISQKVGHEASFQRLSERSDIKEILGDAQLGEAWYSGILGGVPTEE